MQRFPFLHLERARRGGGYEDTKELGTVASGREAKRERSDTIANRYVWATAHNA